MKQLKFHKFQIFPVIYNEGLLFQDLKNLNQYFLWKDNKIEKIDINLLNEKDIYYPDTLEENLQINQAIDIIFSRIQNGEYFEPEFIDIILTIKKRQEYLKKELLKVSL